MKKSKHNIRMLIIRRIFAKNYTPLIFRQKKGNPSVPKDLEIRLEKLLLIKICILKLAPIFYYLGDQEMPAQTWNSPLVS